MTATQPLTMPTHTPIVPRGLDREKRVDALTTLLESGLERFANADAFKAYLRFMTGFHQYSWNNQMLIWIQFPDAQRCAGRTTWLKKKRTIRRGESGIMIWVPMTRKASALEIARGDDNGRGEIVMGFKTGYCFDISQTEGEDIPPMPGRETLVTGKVTDAHIQALIDINTSIGVTTEIIGPAEMATRGRPEGSRGYYTLSKKNVVVLARPPKADMWRTLVHETTHALDHNAGLLDKLGIDENYTMGELVAEGTAYCVATAIGVDVGQGSFAYIASYLGSDTGKEYLQKGIARIKKYTDAILSKLEPTNA